MHFENLAPLTPESLAFLRAMHPHAEVIAVHPESLIKREGRVVELERVSSTLGPMKKRAYVKRAAGPDKRVESAPVYRKKFEGTP